MNHFPTDLTERPQSLMELQVHVTKNAERQIKTICGMMASPKMKKGNPGELHLLGLPPEGASNNQLQKDRNLRHKETNMFNNRQHKRGQGHPPTHIQHPVEKDFWCSVYFLFDVFITETIKTVKQ